MKTLTLLALLALLSLTTQAHAHNNLPDIPPDASSTEYRAHLLTQNLRINDNDGLDPVIHAGERNLAWLEHINSRRAPENKLSFTSKETQNGYPIHAPSEYSPSLILKDFTKLQANYPAELKAVLFQNEAFTDNPPIDEKEYIRWSRLIDSEYQSAARWRTMSGWLPILESRRSNDIRGYYFLSRLENRAEKLKNYSALTPKEKAQIREWLIGLCINGNDAVSTCQRRIDQMIRNQEDLNAYYKTRVNRSASIYNSFFTIPNYARRRDFIWSDKEGSRGLLAPFTDPKTDEVRHFMKFNVEDEWKWGDWRLVMYFTRERGHPYVVFKPGVTPNVNGLGGDRITMNSQQPLTEYDAQWTIRHEFGHVLGLPDCYVEFYASEKQAIVNYQIDVDNIMCSRRGHVKEENVRELERVYRQ